MNKSDNIETHYKESYSRVRMLDIQEIIPQVYNDVIITISEGRHTQHIPDGMSGDRYRTFRKSSGGVFSKDVLAFSRKKPHGQYFLYYEDNLRFIGRIISDEELLKFQSLRLVHGKLIDANYMKFKELGPEDSLKEMRRYIKEKSLIEEEITMEISSNNESVDNEEDSSISLSSISLFDS